MSTRKKISSPHLTLEQRCKLLVESIHHYAIYMLTPDGFIESWNAGAQQLKGYSADEIIGEHFSRFYTEEERAAGIPGRNLKIAETDGKFEDEGWRVRKDGSTFWAHVVIDPVRDENGALIAFAKITRDITAKKMALDALRQSEERFRLLVQSVTDYAIFMLSPTGEVTNWNAGAQHIKGYSADEIIGSHFSRFYTDEDKANGLPAKALETAAKEGKFEAEGWRVRRDGSKFWASVVIDPIHDDNGVLIGFTKITRDMTEKRKAAEMLQHAQAALAQSQKMEAIGKLTGGIAHDFNNLLAGIMGNLDLMRLRIAMGQTAEIGRHLEAAISGAKRSAALTQRLLAFARRQTLIAKPVDVTWLVYSMTELLQRTVGPEIKIDLRVQERPWWTLCDQNQLESALLNLVINGRDAMPAGGKITIETKNVSVADDSTEGTHNIAAGDYVMLSVIDTGTGMTPEIMQHVFEPFFTTKPLGEGTGLGLSMVHGFMNQSGGYVGIDSEVGRGTAVKLYFPRHVPAGEPAETEPEDKTALETGNRSLNILVVDDERAVRTMLVEMLEHFGYRPLAAADAHEAMRLIESAPRIDLLVTDIGLPGGMNGRQLADIARRLRPDLRVLFITGYAEQSVLGKEALPTGMQVMTKPFTMDTFIAAMQGILGTASKKA